MQQGLGGQLSQSFHSSFFYGGSQFTKQPTQNRSFRCNERASQMHLIMPDSQWAAGVRTLVGAWPTTLAVLDMRSATQSGKGE